MTAQRRARALVPVLIAIGGMWLMPAPAAAHAFYSNYCCSDTDCAPAPSGAVTAGPDGWRVRLRPGEHPMVGAPFTALVPYDWERIYPSPDGAFRICILSGKLRCLYVPEIIG